MVRVLKVCSQGSGAEKLLLSVRGAPLFPSDIPQGNWQLKVTCRS